MDLFLFVEDDRPSREQFLLMKQKLPEQLEIIDALPRNPTGKIVKFELRDRYAKP